MDNTISKVALAIKPNFKQRLQTAKTGYLSIPACLNHSVKDRLLQRVRKKFPHLRLGSFETEFEDSQDWQRHFRTFVRDVDVLIVAVDQTRRAGLGVGFEIDRAKQAGKLIFLFDVLTGRYLRYFGYHIETGADGRRTGIKFRDAAQPRTQEKGK